MNLDDINHSEMLQLRNYQLDAEPTEENAGILALAKRRFLTITESDRAPYMDQARKIISG